jgi:hypothetical protein
VSDEDIRSLERLAANDPGAALALARALCRTSPDHGAAVEIRGTWTPGGTFDSSVPGVLTMHMDEPLITVISVACTACRGPADIPDIRIVRRALKTQNAIDPLSGHFVVTVAVDCRAGHDIDGASLYVRYDEEAFVVRGDLSGARSFQRCARCGEDVPYEGTLSGGVRVGETVITAALDAAGIAIDAPSLGSLARAPRLEQARPERRRGRRRRR